MCTHILISTQNYPYYASIAQALSTILLLWLLLLCCPLWWGLVWRACERSERKIFERPRPLFVAHTPFLLVPVYWQLAHQLGCLDGNL